MTEWSTDKQADLASLRKEIGKLKDRLEVSEEIQTSARNRVKELKEELNTTRSTMQKKITVLEKKNKNRKSTSNVHVVQIDQKLIESEESIAYWRKRYEETFDAVTKLEDKRKSDSELLNTTLCNLSRANQELGKLRGTDELTAHKMRAHIAKLEEKVIELHIKNATPNAAKYKRDTQIAQSVRFMLQTVFRWAGAALIIGLICTLTLLTVKYGL